MLHNPVGTVGQTRQRQEHYPLWAVGRLKRLTRVDILSRGDGDGSTEIADKADKNDPNAKRDSLLKDPMLGDLLLTRLTKIPLPAPIGKFPLFFDTNAMGSLWIAVTWGE